MKETLVKVTDYLNHLKKGEILDSVPKMTYGQFKEYDHDANIALINAREYYIQKYGFSLITNSWIELLSEFIGDDKCLEIMGGTGFFSYVLSKKGVNVICTDDYSWEELPDSNVNSWVGNHFCDIERLDAVEAVEKYGKEIKYLIVSWAYMNDTLVKVYKKLKEINPECLIIYIGEREGGCCSCDEFFEISKNSMDDMYNYYDDKVFSNELIELTKKLNDEYTSWMLVEDVIFFVK